MEMRKRTAREFLCRIIHIGCGLLRSPVLFFVSIPTFSNCKSESVTVVRVTYNYKLLHLSVIPSIHQSIH